MDRLVGQLSLCANNTAFRHPLEDASGKAIDPYSVTPENLADLQNATARAVS